MRRFYANTASFTADKVTLGVEETRHLRDVLRLRPGDEISVFDGEGNEFRCRVEVIGKRSTTAIIEAPARPLSPESPLGLTLAAAVLKGDKFDLVVQKAVELGVRRLIPLTTIRCDVKGSAAGRLERWQRISLEATKQCGRAAIMKVSKIAELSDVMARSTTDTILFFSERGGASLSELRTDGRLTVIVGPEGGWDDQELAAAAAANARIITLGGRILRAETAAIAVSAILQNRLGDMN